MNNRKFLLWATVGIQIFCSGIFIANLAVSILGLRTTSIGWQLRETLEVSASVGLMLGAILGVRMILRAERSQQRAEEKLRGASDAFVTVVNQKFQRWALSAAEKDVAWFTIKGFSIKEIAQLRGSSEGTVKAQSNAIYRKVGVSGRAQLLSILVDDMLINNEKFDDREVSDF
ncbi:helix-turn-helix transcriptional regulator [Paramylibacter kogurei]|uniref:helix-turn-helix transcriptional regulator n=1 Tax=Paramylibacter kogurei TaxID=1889778 RepID=UPI001F0B549B|nr:helix-turn-helix transcriptional regulator [Amylibacter kogurei]